METPGESDTNSADFMDADNLFLDCSNDEDNHNQHSLIQDIRCEQNLAATTPSEISKSDSFCSDKSKDLEAVVQQTQPDEDLSCCDADDYLQNKDWLLQKKHVFVLSEAGKPIYSLHGNEDKLVTLFGVVQALVSFVQHNQDAISSIHAEGVKFVFIVRNSLILVGATRTNLSVQQMQLQLGDVYNQILSTLTYSHITKIFDHRKNYDLRRDLKGTERIIDNILVNDTSKRKISNTFFTFLTNSVRVMPLSSASRSNIYSAIQSNCSKIKNLVFAVLIANNKLIALVRMKKYSIHAADLRILFNLIDCSENFKNSDHWFPICLPKFDWNGCLQAHVSYLAEDCQACLILLTVDRTMFETLSEAKQKITEKLRRTHCVEAINEEISRKGINVATIGIPELRHFLYKPSQLAQLLCAELTPPYSSVSSEFERLEAIYCDLHQRIHNSDRPLKLIYEVKEKEVVLAWVTSAYELYAVFEPTVDKCLVIKLVDKLIKWIDKEAEVVFIRTHPTF